jgi:tRNA pseudouridine13 synthase
MSDHFSVEELIQLPSETGAFSYYRVEKHNTPVIDVRKAMASQFKVTPSAVVFPALRDFRFSSVQYASVRKSGPFCIDGEGYTAQRVQQGPRALRSTDLLGNRFTIQLRHFSDAKAKALIEILHRIEEYGLPNYFGAQRFHTKTDSGFIGKAIIKHEPLQALRLYLSEPNWIDSQTIRDFKELVKSHWGQWGYLLHQAPRPSNFRSVITYLKDHTQDYENAVNLIRDQRLARYLETYQAWIWNHILGMYLTRMGDQTSSVDIAGVKFPLLDMDQQLKHINNLIISLPRLTASYTGDLGDVVRSVMDDEGISFEDLNIRLVKRVCLVKRDREAWFAPSCVKVHQSNNDIDSESGSITVSFDLQIRQYATLVIKAALAYLEDI